MVKVRAAPSDTRCTPEGHWPATHSRDPAAKVGLVKCTWKTDAGEWFPRKVLARPFGMTVGTKDFEKPTVGRAERERGPPAREGLFGPGGLGLRNESLALRGG